MDQTTALFKALSDKNRLRVVAALMDFNELCACQITELLQITGATASRHMGVLISAGMVKSRKEGRWVNYRLHEEDPAISRLMTWIEIRLKYDSTVESDRDRLEEITGMDREDLCKKQRGDACCPT